jgi:hypothetical protein
MWGAEGGHRDPVAERVDVHHVWCWHRWQVTASERAPFSRMLASVIGGPR